MEKKKSNKVAVVLGIILILLLIIFLFIVAAYFMLQKSGQKKLAENATTQVPLMTTNKEEITKSETDKDALREGELIYEGKKYIYNSDIMTFVFMGIDSMGTVDELIKQNSGGQADVIFLMVVDQRNKEIKLIGLNRNTMTDVWICDDQYYYIGTEYKQITLQHAYGSGGADSCEKMVAAVDNVMYMIPIHGYFAMNMGAITLLNDSIGGVTLTAIEDIYKSDIKKGDLVTLLGEDAYDYIHNRDHHFSGTADKRLERQKQYLNAFARKIIPMAKKDISIPLKMLDIVSDYSVTDITMDEMTYLFTNAVGYDIDVQNIVSVPGNNIYNEETGYDEFYIDEEALYEMILDIFYEQVE